MVFKRHCITSLGLLLKVLFNMVLHRDSNSIDLLTACKAGVLIDLKLDSWVV